MTDDGTNTGLWKFLADRKNDVSSGERLTPHKFCKDEVWLACFLAGLSVSSIGSCNGRYAEVYCHVNRKLHSVGRPPAGSLYGAKITQAGTAGSVGASATTPFTIEWVLLGRTNQVSFRACDVCPQARMIQQRSAFS